ncbi:Ovate protein family, C-terminal [Dillenia turbinata]|uniref:Transcription repressor n=1 Tax=Dillenia turbinata TaxID=194707 RepID=A0AAN8Z7W3_9MAGN
MSGILWKHFQLCFTKIKCAPEILSPQQSDQENKTNPSSQISSAPSIIIKNFNTIYDFSTSSPTFSSTSSSKPLSTTPSMTSCSQDFSTSDDSSEPDTAFPADLSAVLASQRFFFSSPGLSNSIIDSAIDSPENDTVVAGGVAIPTYSPDPYSDFRRSMQDMVEARGLKDLKASRDYLHELLLCFLTLNPKHTHKYIVSAFADLLISLQQMSSHDSQTPM